MIVGKVVEAAAITGGYFVKKGTAENGVVLSTAGDLAYGIARTTNELWEVPIGSAVDVALVGEVTKVMLAATLTAGDEVVSDANGKAVAIGTASGTRYFRGAVLLESGVSGELVDAVVACDWKTVAPIGSDLGTAPSVCGQHFESSGIQYISAYSAAGTAIGDVEMVSYTETSGQEITAITPVSSIEDRQLLVAAEVIGAGAIGWYQIGGIVEASVEGTVNVAAGDFLEVLNGEDDFKKEGAARTRKSAAVAIDAQAVGAAVVVTVFLINQAHPVGSPLDITPTVAGQKWNDIENGKEYISAYSTGALTLGDVVMLTYAATAGQEVTAAAVATTAFPVLTAVASANNAGTALSWFQVGGLCEASVDGTAAVVADDALEVINAADDFIKDGAARTTVTGAIAVDAQAAGTSVITVMLINEQHTIAAA